jgi:hypothetical protein
MHPLIRACIACSACKQYIITHSSIHTSHYRLMSAPAGGGRAAWLDAPVTRIRVRARACACERAEGSREGWGNRVHARMNARTRAHTHTHACASAHTHTHLEHCPGTTGTLGCSCCCPARAAQASGGRRAAPCENPLWGSGHARCMPRARPAPQAGLPGRQPLAQAQQTPRTGHFSPPTRTLLPLTEWPPLARAGEVTDRRPCCVTERVWSVFGKKL